MKLSSVFQYYFSLIICTGFFLTLNAQTEDIHFKHQLKENKKPWTNKPFYNDPNNFQFAIVSDRTGGHREGVFGKALEKINQLHPEFVMSVGDLIEGYTKDTRLLNQQWNEFHGILDSLRTKFFYVAGNHDYSNSTMAEQWKERYGKDYYHFIYKNVLFLIVNSNDGDGVIIEKDQIEYLKAAIAQNTDVRWTMVFTHHPMWTYGDVNGFNEVEEALKGRDYTVFAGHTHRYLFEARNDQNHYILASTGGGSKLRGPKFGEFDHVGWVTMTDEGPKLVNLALSGILDHDVSNVESLQSARKLIKSTDFKPLVLRKDDERKIILSLNNSSNKTIHFEGQLYHHHQIEPDASHFKLELPPNSFKNLVIKTKPVGAFKAADWDPLELQWKMGFKSDFMEPEFSLNGTELIELNSNELNVSMTEQNVFLKDLKVELKHPFKDLSAKYTLNNEDSNSSTYSEPLNIKSTTRFKVILEDSLGFKSGTYIKEYEKVSPLAAERLKSPKKGLTYSYYEGNFSAVPDFKKLTSKKTGTTLELDPEKIGQRLDHYAIQYQGYINIPKTGIYTFYLTSDDGSKLYINNELAVNNDGSHDVRTKKGMIALKKGWHPVRIDYFEDFLGERLKLEYSSPDMEKTQVTFGH